MQGWPGGGKFFYISTRHFTDFRINLEHSLDTDSKPAVSAVSEIVQGNSNLNQRTQKQASALEETASSTEQMTSTVTQSARHGMLQLA